MRNLMLVAAVLALMLGAMVAADAAVNLSIVSAGPVYVAPVSGATPFVGGLLALNLPRTWGIWTDYLKPAAVIQTAGIVGQSALSPALALPISLNGAPAVFVGVTYVPGAQHTCLFAGVDLVAALGALK